MTNQKDNTPKDSVNVEDLLDKPILFDLERMKSAMATETVMVPPGLTRKEIIAFITSHAKNK